VVSAVGFGEGKVINLIPQENDKINLTTVLSGRYGRKTLLRITGDSIDFLNSIVDEYKNMPYYRVVAVSPCEISDSVANGLFSALITIEHWDYISPMCIPFPKLSERCRLAVVQSAAFGQNHA